MKLICKHFTLCSNLFKSYDFNKFFNQVVENIIYKLNSQNLVILCKLAISKLNYYTHFKYLTIMKNLFLTIVAVLALGTMSSCSFEEMAKQESKNGQIDLLRGSGGNAIDPKVRKDD